MTGNKKKKSVSEERRGRADWWSGWAEVRLKCGLSGRAANDRISVLRRQRERSGMKKREVCRKHEYKQVLVRRDITDGDEKERRDVLGQIETK